MLGQQNFLELQIFFYPENISMTTKLSYKCMSKNTSIGTDGVSETTYNAYGSTWVLNIIWCHPWSIRVLTIKTILNLLTKW